MNRSIFAITIAAMMCLGSSALAEETAPVTPSSAYSTDGNSVEVTGARNYRTVIITKDDAEPGSGIVYINQATSGTFDESVNFLIKANPAEGDYTITLGGGENVENYTGHFTILAKEPEDMEPAVKYVETNATDPSKKDLCFGWESVDGSKIQSIVLTINGTSVGYNFVEGDLPTVASGDINLGVRITGIDVDTEGASAYLSSETLSLADGN